MRPPRPPGTASAAWVGLLALSLLLSSLHGCASTPPPAPGTVLVLLPDDSGQTGRVTVTHPGGTQELTRAGDGIRIPAGASGPPATSPMSAEEITRVFGAALTAQPGPPAYFQLYFEDDSDTLTRASQARLGDVVRSVAERRAIDVSIVGHTDTVGTREYNFRLGLRRALKVQEAILVLPIDRSILRVDSHGKDAPLVATGDNVPEPQNRRVEVTVR